MVDQNSYMRDSTKVSKNQFCNELKSTIQNESNAGSDYRKMKKQASNLGFAGTAADFQLMSVQEETHHNLQKSIYNLKCGGDM